MGSTPPRQFRSKSGEAITVRTAAPEDAAFLLAHAREVIGESEFVLTEPDEFDLTEEQEREWIGQHLDAPGDLALVAEIGGRIVGLLFFESGRRRRLAHRGTLHMSVGRPWRSRGVGAALLQSLIDWATEHPDLEKLCLAVLATNERAVGLYRKFGFVEEGRRPKEVKLGPGEYLDDVLMYRFVGTAPTEDAAAISGSG